jgi:phosphopantothenoylcysteine decarboxylase/phosphopantothenate--cysteine ligase
VVREAPDPFPDPDVPPSPPSTADTSPPRRVLVTAGPTFEPIDEVRYLANRSSGRMGVALAEAAVTRGHAVTLLLGPSSVPPPETSSLTVLRFRTAADLQRLLEETWPRHDLLLMAAAVADYRPEKPATPGGHAGDGGKIRRGDAPITLRLVPTPDLLAAAARSARPDQTLVGFALEPADRLAEAAAEKLRRKGVDAIVANPLGTLDAETVTATVIRKDGTSVAAPPDLPKRAFAEWLLEQL